jgi:hypothetical protein
MENSMVDEADQLGIRLAEHNLDTDFILKKVLLEKIQHTEQLRELPFPANTQDELLMRYETLTEVLNIVESVIETKQRIADAKLGV